MGGKSSRSVPSPSPPPPPPGSASTPVTLNVYDLTPLNKYTSCFGFGIFHSGIEVYGMEYGFGAHDYPASGVFEVDPKSCPGFSYRCSIPLGYTSMLPFEFREFIEHIGADYHGDSYHLILKNCNHFTTDVCLKLTGKSIPKWVNRVAYVGAICCCILPKNLKIDDVKGDPAFHGLCGESRSTRDDKSRFFPSPDSETALMEEGRK